MVKNMLYHVVDQFQPSSGHGTGELVQFQFSSPHRFDELDQLPENIIHGMGPAALLRDLSFLHGFDEQWTLKTGHNGKGGTWLKK